MGTKAESNASKPSQWRLSTLLMLMLGFAIVFAGIARIHGKVEMQVDFSALPKTDDALAKWLKETYRASDIKIERPSDKSISVTFTRPMYSLDIPIAPWDKLGYGTLGSFIFSQSQVFGWWIPIGLLIILCAGRMSRNLQQIVAFFFPARRQVAPKPEFADR